MTIAMWVATYVARGIGHLTTAPPSCSPDRPPRLTQIHRRPHPLRLAPVPFGILGYLVAADGRSQQRLADLLHVHRHTMVGLVNELAELGLVRRSPHPYDRRAHVAHLTDGAHRVLDIAQTQAQSIEEYFHPSTTPNALTSSANCATCPLVLD
ncbi:MarR family winged helix-turn-helix transcriptional regulator [Nocardia jinanensis]|uniref:MarR family winged helix-turn-helix transcriptional regulator n=1 Tax=Nocardia jinanensis TaxID=382504 RepID=UPI001663E042|nr:MarR family winged helix-turn-helix transcriptional regulator [Nocardia jinanensis]